ncbi:MAG: glucokinase [Casimicrobium sp.]
MVGDIGGTNARFAWLSDTGAPLTKAATYRCADFTSLTDAVLAYLEAHQLTAPEAFAFGIATPVNGDEVRMTNHHWSFSISALRRAIGAQTGVVINDFLALACAIPALRAVDYSAIGRAQRIERAPIALIGPGTGLGVATLFADRFGEYHAVPGEGGHVTLAANNDREEAVIGVLRKEFGHVSAERAISGPGLLSIYQAVCKLDRVEAVAVTPADVTHLAASGGNLQCTEAVVIFTSLLGSVAGNLALTIGAFGGVYIGGGIVPRLGAQFDRERFRKSFEAKGRFADYLSRVPSYLITYESPALLGAARYLDQHLANLV